ncbi:gliding motility-associated C-terminal domain-containing protein [Bacteroidales bacterium OttesenSCG-928-B11]|nr:gliding motility-associated C-terminal domain-containing protein [Bacteroidales bacterium OttesenSCG-928-E04]MDL2312851.1 gliding motility-associated C-terminal domain-containing protein [Bacteroidales bacterium OttesenSCG-928-B11]MDL2325853.1 gliding motility-associated C-terminal domain-containing protein [Bacteroidales bacterium OttesenSCG-928-A14]
MKEIGDFFKEKIANGQADPPADIWEKIAADSRVVKYNRIRNLQKGMLYSLPTIVIVAIVIVSIVLLQRDLPKIQQDNTAPTSAIENTNVESNPGNSSPEITPIKETPPTKAVLPHNPAQPIQSEHLITENVEPPQSVPAQTSIIETTPVLAKIPAAKPTVAMATNTVTEEPPAVENIPVSDKKKEQSVAAEEKPPIQDDSYEKFQDQDTETENSWETPIHRDNIPDLSIPDAFSPNSDGLNDEFKAQAHREVTDFNMYIYDRTGQLLFHAKDVNIGWNGEYSGQRMPANTYVYVITYRNENGEKKIRKGMCVLVR